MRERCELSVFSNTRLIIKRTYSRDEIISNSAVNFKAEAAKFRQMIKNGKASSDVELVLYFDPITGKVEVDLNRFLPFYYVLSNEASLFNTIRTSCVDKDVINRPVLIMDFASLSE